MEQVTINGRGPFYEKPPMCGCCKCFIPNDMRRSGGKGFCSLFAVHKNHYDNLPARCVKMFDAAFRFGGDVVLVEKENSNH